ncbi:MAG: PIN/TRAM domain-containing protein [Schwartzia sp.]|nr:PIN/TRAM domain-containing protein [Schwartzia sp. (in: firmicutes)]
MLDKILRFFIAAFMALAGGALMQLASPVLTLFISTEILKMDMGIFKMTLATLVCVLIGAILGVIIGLILAPYFIKKLTRFTAWVEAQLNKMPIHDVIAGAVGLAIGLILAALLGSAFSHLPIVGNYIPIVFSIVFGYLGIRITMKKREDFTAMFDFIPRLIRDIAKLRERQAQQEAAAELQPAAFPAQAFPTAALQADKGYKLLDTSVIIDGRIADIIQTDFLEGTLLIPVFVLEELQHIADSSDVLKRTRGRRGLDILQKIRTESKMKVEVTNQDFEDITEVDSKLVRLGQLVGGKIITNDYNLNKVSQLCGVPVLNINELANAVKPVVIPGESMQVTIVKDGKEQGQGVAYLDDGTMIVIEGGHRYINSTIDVEVTSVLQTAAGRMIFARPRK